MPKTITTTKMNKKDIIIQRSYNRSVLKADDKGRTLTGYAIVFGERSVMMPDPYYDAVYEVIEPDAISDDVLKTSDVIANINHNDDFILGRSCQGSGSLHMTKDEHGLLISVDAPNTVYGDVAYEGIKRGDFAGMSFASGLFPKEDVTYETLTEDGKEIHIRHINRIRALYDVSVVTIPAYPSTEIETRSAEIRAMVDKDKKAEEEKVKRQKAAEQSQDYLNKMLEGMD